MFADTVVVAAVDGRGPDNPEVDDEAERVVVAGHAQTLPRVLRKRIV